MARSYELPTTPQYIQDLIDCLYRIRDYHSLVVNRPTEDSSPINVMLQENYATLQTVKSEWFNQAQAAIRNIRGARNSNPLWTIDEIEPPEPDPVDVYYYDPGSLYYTKNPHPTAAGEPPGWDPHTHFSAPGGTFGGGLLPPLRFLPVSPSPTPLRLLPFPRPPRPRPPRPWPPWPPWPPPPPFPPPPVFWRPPAEEAYSYVYALYYLADYYIADMQLSELEFQYWGYYFAELLKNCYALNSFWLTQQVVKSYLMPYLSRLDAALPLTA